MVALIKDEQPLCVNVSKKPSRSGHKCALIHDGRHPIQAEWAVWRWYQQGFIDLHEMEGWFRAIHKDYREKVRGR